HRGEQVRAGDGLAEVHYRGEHRLGEAMVLFKMPGSSLTRRRRPSASCWNWSRDPSAAVATDVGQAFQPAGAPAGWKACPTLNAGRKAPHEPRPSPDR